MDERKKSRKRRIVARLEKLLASGKNVLTAYAVRLVNEEGAEADPHDNPVVWAKNRIQARIDEAKQGL